MLGRLFRSLLIVVGLGALVAIAGHFALRRGDIAYETLAAKYEDSASRYADLPGGVRMHYRDEGLANEPTLLLVHGFSDSNLTWRPWIERLGDAYRLVSIDLPGHGLTSAPSDYAASIEAYRDAVEDFAAAQNLSRFAIIGSSMGGNVAWEYTLAHPERVEALVLVGASGYHDARAAFAERSPMFALMRNATLRPVLRDLDTSALVRQGLQASFADPSLADEALVTRFMDYARAPGHRDQLIDMTLNFGQRALASPERLAPLRAPTIILHGEMDNLVGVEQGRLFHEQIAGSALIIYPHVGHLLQLEIPDQSAGDLEAFLARVYPVIPSDPAATP